MLNSYISSIQKIEPMESLRDKLLRNIYLGVGNNKLSNGDVVQIIELCGELLNLETISSYAKSNNLSYNGVKNNRQVIAIFGCKLVIDND